MKQALSYVFCMIFLISLASTEDTSSLRLALDVALNSLVASQKFAAFSNKYGLNATKPACSSPTPSTYPRATGLLKTILDSGSITFCQFLNSSIPFWDVSRNTGFLDDLTNGILDEWHTYYGKRLSSSWFHVSSKFGFFVDLHSALKSGSCQVVGDTTTIIAARKNLIDFACPFTSITSGFLRGPLEPTRTNLTTLEALNDPSVKVGVLKGTIYDSPSGGVSKAQRIMYPSDAEALTAAANQVVHASLMEAPQINSWLISNPCSGCKYYDDGKGTQEYAFFVTISSANSIIANFLTSLLLMVVVIVIII